MGCGASRPENSPTSDSKSVNAKGATSSKVSPNKQQNGGKGVQKANKDAKATKAAKNNKKAEKQPKQQKPKKEKKKRQEEDEEGEEEEEEEQEEEEQEDQEEEEQEEDDEQEENDYQGGDVQNGQYDDDSDEENEDTQAGNLPKLNEQQKKDLDALRAKMNLLKDDGEKISYGDPCTSDHTLNFLKGLASKNKMANKLMKLDTEALDFDTTKLDKGDKIGTYVNDYVDLVVQAVDNMCICLTQPKRDEAGGKNWRTTTLYLIQAIYQSQFSDLVINALKTKLSDLQSKKYSPDEKESKAALTCQYPKNTDKGLMDFFQFPNPKKYKLPGSKVPSNKDEEFIAMYGEVAVPSEIEAVTRICEWVKENEKVFKSEFEQIFPNSHFKANSKNLGRIVYKMGEYASDPKKERPSFNHCFDLLRGKASYEKKEQAIEAYDRLRNNKKYEILKAKDKLNDKLQNLTINVRFQNIIAEIQIEFGHTHAEGAKPGAEQKPAQIAAAKDEVGHKIYELSRCTTIPEMHKTILAWEGLDYTGIRPIGGRVLPKTNLESQTWKAVYSRAVIGIMRSKEFGYFPTEYLVLHEDSGSMSFQVPLKRLVVLTQKDKKRLISLSLLNIVPLDPSLNVTKVELEFSQLINGVKGTFCDKGIMYLELHTKDGKTQVFGDPAYANAAKSSDKTAKAFDLNVPSHCVVHGFGCRVHPTKGLQSIYCWFGRPPFDDPNSRIAAKWSPNVYRTDSSCPHCTRQMCWYNSIGINLNCDTCQKPIPNNVGGVACFKDMYATCSGCFIKAYPKAQPIPSFNKDKCLNEKHEVTFAYKGSDVKCNKCQYPITATSARYSCPCKHNYCSSCVNESNVQPLQTFPTAACEMPCTSCKKTMNWYPHAGLAGYGNHGFSCNLCTKTYRSSAGLYHCDSCDFDLCCGCYTGTGQHDITSMPNYTGQKCPKGATLTWNFKPKEKWQCDVCKGKFNEKTGCYMCPKKDCDGYRECSGCYMRQISSFDIGNVQIANSAEAERGVSYITPHGKIKSNLECPECRRDLLWIWYRNAAGSSFNPTYSCSSHQKDVPVNLGSFYCYKCDFDMCSSCYVVNNKTEGLVDIPNPKGAKCPKGQLLSWKYKVPKGWICGSCKVVADMDFGAYTCEPNCKCSFKECAVCAIGLKQEATMMITQGLQVAAHNNMTNWLDKYNDDTKGQSGKGANTLEEELKALSQFGMDMQNMNQQNAQYKQMEKEMEKLAKMMQE